MSVYKNSNGNLYGGTIHNNDDKSYIDCTQHIINPEYLGKVKIYF